MLQSTGDIVVDDLIDWHTPHETAEFRSLLNESTRVLDRLSDRDRAVLLMRCGVGESEPMTFKAIGERIGGLSSTRAQQLYRRVIRRLEHLKDRPVESDCKPSGERKPFWIPEYHKCEFPGCHDTASDLRCVRHQALAVSDWRQYVRRYNASAGYKARSLAKRYNVSPTYNLQAELRRRKANRKCEFPECYATTSSLRCEEHQYRAIKNWDEYKRLRDASASSRRPVDTARDNPFASACINHSRAYAEHDEDWSSKEVDFKELDRMRPNLSDRDEYANWILTVKRVRAYRILEREMNDRATRAAIKAMEAKL